MKVWRWAKWTHRNSLLHNDCHTVGALDGGSRDIGRADSLEGILHLKKASLWREYPNIAVIELVDH